MNNTNQEFGRVNKKFGRILAGGQNEPGKEPAVLSKADARYWLAKGKDRLFKEKGTSNYSCRLMLAGRRERFGLSTSNANKAALKAAAIYNMLMAEGWIAAFAKFKPKAAAAGDLRTVGEWLAAVEQHCPIFAHTFQNYASALRKLAADLAGIKNDKTRFDYKGGGNAAWRSQVDAVKLETLTLAAVNAWRTAYTKGKPKAPDAQRRALNSARAHVRNAKAMFGTKIVKLLRTAGFQMPEHIPLSDVSLPEMFGKRLSSRYVSRFNPSELLRDAGAELAGQTASETATPAEKKASATKAEAFKILLLALLCGLRRREIDALAWSQCDLERGVIRLETTEHIRLKSEDSADVVELDVEMLALLRGWKAGAKGSFVVEPGIMVKDYKSRTAYRCELAMDTLSAWLRGKGITARKPLHELRKESGNLVAAARGIFAASRFLRHSDIRITSESYADKPERITTGLAGLLPTPENVVSITTGKSTSTERKARLA